MKDSKSDNEEGLGKYNTYIRQARDIYIGNKENKDNNSQTIPKQEKLLLDKVSEKVRFLLKKSLHNAVLINLEKELQPHQVSCPWNAEIKIGLKSEPLSSETSIIEVFQHDEIQGKLLILGKPGSGKSTTLLELGEQLIKLTLDRSLDSIPVLLNLSSWKDTRQSMSDWIIAEIKTEYGVLIDTSKLLLKEQKLLPMLDGLDELESSLQEACVRAINTLLSEDNRPRYMVICSRSEEYGHYKINLNLKGAICLQPLSDQQIQNYLTQVQQPSLWKTFPRSANC